MSLDIVIFGLALSSSWGNGHATTWRALIRALAARGHRVTFFERDQPWYSDNRDLPDPAFCRLVLYTDNSQAFERFGPATRQADVVISGSYVADGIGLNEWILKTARGITAFYDIDTPVTQVLLDEGRCDFITRDIARQFDIYLSFTGGPMLNWLKREHGIERPRALYCSADPHDHRPVTGTKRYALGYLGTYSADREAAFRELFLKPAEGLPSQRYAVAGSQYPAEARLPGNVAQLGHLAPGDHAAFYAAQNFPLNLTRAAMMQWGWSPSVRLFEAAACGIPVITDDWPGLPEFLRPGDEMLVAKRAEDVTAYLSRVDAAARARIGAAARVRVAAQHTAHHRARSLESYIREALRARKRSGPHAA